ncbi:MAG: hypothetical protein WAW84_01305 [Candidatus Rickettsiella isopodorum]|nr:hypothetical protein [Pseudomonadota bacterium]
MAGKKKARKLEEKDNLVRMNFEVSEKLRHAFKGKVMTEGKKVKGVLAAFMKEYIKK